MGLVVIDLITSPVVSWRGCETPPQYRGSAVILCMTPSEVSGAGGEGTLPEATPVPQCQHQKPRPSSREKRGVEPEAPCRKTSCSKQEGKLPGEQPASQPCGENPARHRAGERQHPLGSRSRPNPRWGRKATGPEKEGPRPTSPSVRGPPTAYTPEARTVKRGTYFVTEQNGRPKDDTKPPRGKAGLLAEPNCSNSFNRDQIKDPDPPG